MAKASTVHLPEHATLRARIVVEGKQRLLFYVPSSDPTARPYLFACGPNGEAPSCECAYRHQVRHDQRCELVRRAAEVAARAR